MIDGNKKVCSKLDKTKASKPCQQFAPNVKPIAAMGQQSLGALANLIRSLDSDVLRSLSVLMHNEPKTRKQKMTFMQPVFVRYRGQANRNYISNFMRAYVMYATPKHYKLMSQDGRCVLTYTANCRPVIFTEDEFEPMHALMLRKGALVDPDTEQLIVRRFRCEEEYELNLVEDEAKKGQVSTIDDVFKGNGIKKGRKKGKMPDLISLVADAAEGYNVEKESRVYVRDTKRKKPVDQPRRSEDIIVDVSGGAND